MELELGLKITQTKDDQSSATDIRMLKDSLHPVFMSRETQSKFILTAHLKGFGKEHIGIRINEDGTQIFIRLEKPVQETVMSNWMVHKKEMQLKGFIRAFHIPSNVVLDRIKANFNDQESLLTVLLPKSVKGLRGRGIEEVNEEESTRREVVEEHNDGDPTTQMPSIKNNEDLKDKIRTESQKGEHSKASTTEAEQKGEETEISDRSREMGDQTQSPEMLESIITADSLQKVEAELLGDIEAMIFSRKHESDGLPDDKRNGGKAVREENGNSKTGNEARETEKVGDEPAAQNKLEPSGQEADTREEIDLLVVLEELLKDIEADTLSTKHNSDRLPEKNSNELITDEAVCEENRNSKTGNEAQETDTVGEEHDDGYKEMEEEEKAYPRKKTKLCRPCVIAGSTILVSLVVIAIHWIRSRKRQLQ